MAHTSRLPHEPAQLELDAPWPTDAPLDAPGPLGAGCASLAVLSADPALIGTLTGLDARHGVICLSTESELAERLLAEPPGVILIDAAAVTTPIQHLTERLQSQFPDIVIIVAGDARDQATLGTQITQGRVYRFLHKPASDQRLRLFVDAAWRRHAENRPATSRDRMVAPTGSTAKTLSWLPLALAAGLAVIALIGWIWLRTQGPGLPPSTARAPAASPGDPPHGGPMLDSLLARAEVAFAAGHMVDPGNGAVDLYRRVLRLHPGDERATTGLGRVIQSLLASAERALADQRPDEAQSLLDEARGIDPDHVGVAFLTARLGNERERSAAVHPSASTRKAAGSTASSPTASTPIAGDSASIPGASLVTNSPADMRSAVKSGGTADAATAVGPMPAVAIQPSSSADAVVPLESTVERAPSTPAPTLASTPAPTLASTPAPAPAPIAKSATQAGSAAAAANPQPAESAFATMATLERTRYAAPTYPPRARAGGITGWVDLQFVVAPDGSVDRVTVLEAQPKGVFEQSALNAMRKWRFKPTLRDGRPVEQPARLRMRFALEG